MSGSASLDAASENVRVIRDFWPLTGNLPALGFVAVAATARIQEEIIGENPFVLAIDIYVSERITLPQEAHHAKFHPLGRGHFEFKKSDRTTRRS
jgi:hypothetical protein